MPVAAGFNILHYAAVGYSDVEENSRPSTAAAHASTLAAS